MTTRRPPRSSSAGRTPSGPHGITDAVPDNIPSLPEWIPGAGGLNAVGGFLGRAENVFPVIILLLMSVLPLVELASRKFQWVALAGSSTIVQHLTLWIMFVGAALAARSGGLLSLSMTTFMPDWFRARAKVIAGFACAAVAGALAWASWLFLESERSSGETIALGIPVWVSEVVMVTGFALIALRAIWLAADRPTGRLVAALGLVLAIGLGFMPELAGGPARTILVCGIIVATVLGLPIFATLGGLALVLFWGTGTPPAAVPAETYRLSASPMLPAIPLFTLAGHILSEGGACKRLVRVFNALVGWMPGGLAIVTTVVFAFFTTFTGASGVTILSLGGLLYPVLRRSKYSDRFSIGLVTASGSIGLLFPPSLPVILYGVRSFTMYNGQPYVAQIDQLFIAGLIPGLFLVALVSAWGVWTAWSSGAPRRAFEVREALRATWEAKWELAIPLLIVAGVFSGFATVVETAAFTLLWSIVTECLIYRDLSVRRDMVRVMAQGAALVGAVMLVLGAAVGFTNYLVDAGAPTLLAEFVKAHVNSKFTFLLLLNIFMIIVGSVIEIFSAILVVVPLIVPMGAAFGVHPVHLGIIFLANLELGYLMPPIGLNLLLASSRFGKSMSEVAWATLPFLIIMTIGVLLITYVPAMSLGLLYALGKG